MLIVHYHRPTSLVKIGVSKTIDWESLVSQVVFDQNTRLTM